MPGMELEDYEVVEEEQENNELTDQEGWVDVQTDPSEIPFEGNSGIKVDIATNSIPIDFFLLFWSDDVMQLIVDETNRYATTLLNNSNVTRNSRISHWKPLDIVELKHFLASVIFMGIIKMQSLRHYYRNDKYLMLHK